MSALKTYQGGRRHGRARFVGLLTSQAYNQLPSTDPVAAAQGRERHRSNPDSRRMATTPRRWSTCWTHSRATSCSASASRCCSPGRGRSSIWSLRPRTRRARSAGTGSTGSCPHSCLPAARPLLRRAYARASDGLLATAYDGRVSAFTPFFPEGPLVRVHFIIGRGEGARPAGRRGSAGSCRSTRPRAPGPTGWPARSPPLAGAAGRSRRNTQRAFSAGLRRHVPGRARRRGHRAHRAPWTRPADRDRLLSRARSADHRGSRRHLSLRHADPAVGARAGAGELRLPR